MIFKVDINEKLGRVQRNEMLPTYDVTAGVFLVIGEYFSEKEK